MVEPFEAAYIKEVLVYKPRATGGGCALKLNVRAAVPEGDKGGLFVEFAQQQGPAQPGKHPTFGWGPQAKDRVVGKLGLPDILGMLVAYEQLRRVQGPLPWERRAVTGNLAGAKGKDPAHCVEFFHKSNGGSLIITWQFTPEGSYFGASRQAGSSPPQRASISLNLSEELLLVRYLERALDVFIEAGMR